MDEEKRNLFKKSVIIVQLILAIEVLVLAIPSIFESYREMRWFQLNGLVIYHGIGAAVLFLFSLVLLQSYYTNKSAVNLRYFTLAILFAGFTFLWSFIADSTANLKADPQTPQEVAMKTHDIFNHDTLWYPLLALFTLFLYFSIESASTDKPPIKRMMIVTVGCALPIVLGIASRLDEVNYVSGNSILSVFSIIATFILGTLFVVGFGVLTYYRQLDNVRDQKLIMPAMIQFSALLGLSEGLILLSIDFAAGTIFGFRPLNVQFPLILLSFLPLLVFVYARHPSYISTLSTPIFELLVVSDAGNTVYSHQFSADDVDEKDTALLKGGVISALVTIFQDITGTKSSIDKVELDDRNVLLEKIRLPSENKTIDRTWIIGLIVLSTNAMIRNSLKIFRDQLVEHLGDDIHQPVYHEVDLNQYIHKIFY